MKHLFNEKFQFIRLMIHAADIFSGDSGRFVVFHYRPEILEQFEKTFLNRSKISHLRLKLNATGVSQIIPNRICFHTIIV